MKSVKHLKTSRKAYLIKILEILKNLSLFSEKRGDQMQDLINKFETLLTRDKVEKCKQVKITSYFVKEK